MKTEGNKKQRRDTKKQRLQREKGLAALLLAPTLIVFSIFMFWPLIRTVELSFYKWNMSSPDKKFVGLDNYLKVLTSPVIGKVLANTLWYILLFILIDFVLPYLISYLLSFVCLLYTSGNQGR